MKWLTSDNKMLGYELMKAYPNISCFSTTWGRGRRCESQPGIAA